MGKLQNILKQLIKEEINIFLKEEQDNANIDVIVDYLLDFEDEEINENIPKKPIMKVQPNPTGPQQTMKRPIVRQQPNPTIKGPEDLEEAQGRIGGSSRKYKLKSNHTIEEVTKFLKKVQYRMKNKKGQGRKPHVFTDDDIEKFADILTRPEGFERRDILNNISFYKGKPFQAAQRMMDVLGADKITSNVDKEGNLIHIGQGYITVLDTPKKEKTSKKKEYDIEDDLDISDPEEDFDEFDGDLSDLDSRDNYLNEMKILQKRAGLLNG